MKKLILLIIALSAIQVSAQVGIGVSTANIDSSAQLEVASNNKGFLAPRMTEFDRSNINSPASGLLVYQTDGAIGFYFYDGTIWKQILGLLSSGTANQVLTSDGAGSTSWSNPTQVITEAADEFTAQAGDVGFTLTHIPASISKVKMFINGIRISNTAYSFSGTSLTYDPSLNGNYVISVLDRIQFDYSY